MEDAGPFLDAVDASEVPDYYDVIKVPRRLHLGCPQRPSVRRAHRIGGQGGLQALFAAVYA